MTTQLMINLNKYVHMDSDHYKRIWNKIEACGVTELRTLMPVDDRVCTFFGTGNAQCIQALHKLSFIENVIEDTLGKCLDLCD